MCYYKIFIFWGTRKVVILNLFNLSFRSTFAVSLPACYPPRATLHLLLLVFSSPTQCTLAEGDTQIWVVHSSCVYRCKLLLMLLLLLLFCPACSPACSFLRTCRHFIELYMNCPLMLSTVDLQWMLGNKHGGKVKSLWNVWNFFKFVPFICLVCQRYMD